MLFGAPRDKKRPTIDHAANFLDHIHNIQNYARQHLKLASDRMKTDYDWPTARPTTRVTKCGSDVQPAQRLNRPSSILMGVPVYSSQADK
jgi:hypothetical protein